MKQFPAEIRSGVKPESLEAQLRKATYIFFTQETHLVHLQSSTKKHIQRSMEPATKRVTGTIYPCFPQGKIWKDSPGIKHSGKQVLSTLCHIISVALVTMFLLGIGKLTMFFMSPVITACTHQQPRSSSLAVATHDTIRTLLRKCSPKLSFRKPEKKSDIRENYVEQRQSQASKPMWINNQNN